MRPASKPDDQIALRRYTKTCAVQDKEIETLNITSCAMPAWVNGFNSTGISPNAYGRSEDVKSLALTSGSGGLTGGQKAGIAVGSVVGALLMAAAVVFGIFKWRRSAAEKKKKEAEMHQVEKGSIASD